MKITVLGCGSSPGVPVIGCDCAVCRSDNPKNKRLRVSLLIETNGKNILIDSSPDLRQQALAANIRQVDAVLFTHDHADHTGGLDDLRAFNHIADVPLPVYGPEETINSLKNRYNYAFLPKPERWFRPSLVPHALPEGARHDFALFGQPISMFQQLHGKVKSYGYRIGNMAYSTDTDGLEDSAFETLAGIDLWIVDCLRATPSASHSYLEQTLGWIARAKPKRAVLTHMAHEFEYEALAKQLPPGVIPGYDGLVLELP